MSPVVPETDSKSNIVAATRYQALNNCYFLDATLRGAYPQAFIDEHTLETMGYKSGDDRIMRAELNWIGINYYTRRIASAIPVSGPNCLPGNVGDEMENGEGAVRDRYLRFRSTMPTTGPLTDAGLEIFPKGMYDLVMMLTRNYPDFDLEVTESGCSYVDPPLLAAESTVPDWRRIAYHRDHLIQLWNAISDGAKVRAYHAWSLLDNFEWTDGYTQRYGFVYVDFRNQKRMIKDAGLWYAKVAETNEVDD
jgi:beta-glucosidase